MILSKVTWLVSGRAEARAQFQLPGERFWPAFHLHGVRPWHISRTAVTWPTLWVNSDYSHSAGISLLFFSLKKKRFYLFLRRGEGREKQSDRNIDWLPLTRPQSDPHATQACAQARNQTHHLSGLWDDAQPSEPYRSGLLLVLHIHMPAASQTTGPCEFS